MIMQVLLTGGLAFVFLFYLANSHRGSLLTFVVVPAMVAGLVFVWHPELSNRIAEQVGVGRGADLIFYCWIVISMALFVATHLKLRQLHESLTKLVREITIAEALENRSKTRSSDPENDDVTSGNAP